MASPDLLWMLTKNNSSFLVKRESGRVQFSTDKYNLTSTNSFKAQGISNAKAVDISQHYADADKEKKSPKGITVSFKSGTLDKKGDWVPKSVNNPSKMNKTTVCAKDPARSFKRVAKCIKSQVSRTRPDLVKPARALDQVPPCSEAHCQQEGCQVNAAVSPASLIAS